MRDMIQFGTGGWRAVIGDTFIRSNIRRVAAAVARRMHREAAIWFSEVVAGEGV